MLAGTGLAEVNFRTWESSLGINPCYLEILLTFLGLSLIIQTGHYWETGCAGTLTGSDDYPFLRWFLSVYLLPLGLQTSSLKSFLAKRLLQAVTWDRLCPGTVSPQVFVSTRPGFWACLTGINVQKSCLSKQWPNQSCRELCTHLGDTEDGQDPLSSAISPMTALTRVSSSESAAWETFPGP